MFIKNHLLHSLGTSIEHLTPSLSDRHFRSGQVIKANGDATYRVYFPTSGLISSRVVLQTGHEIECALIGNSNAAGLLGALGWPAGWARFICLTDGHAWTISPSHLAAAARIQPAIERELSRFAFAQLGYAAHVGVCNAMHTAEQRLARWLATAARLLGRPDVSISQDELAAILGLQRSAVNPALQRLKTFGALEVTRGRIAVVDANRLRGRACECIEPLGRALSGAHALLAP